MENSPPNDQKVIPAATVVIFRNGRAGPEPEILMVVRGRDLSFAGGAAVFPGGKVDAEDRELADAVDHSCSDNDEAAHRIAAIRETLEETGLIIGVRGSVSVEDARHARNLNNQAGDLAAVLDRFDWSLTLDRLVPFSRWLPLGLISHRIFDTRFYIYNVGTGELDIAVDAVENTRLFWTSASEALAMADREEISIIFPTRRNLERLAQFANFDEARRQAEAIPVRTITPEITDDGERQTLTIPDDLGYPVTSESFDTLHRG